jgi:hypothetical protein
MVARKSFDPSAPNHGRDAVRYTLLAISEYISAVVPQRPDLVHPLRELLLGLKDLDRGAVVPLLQPSRIDHRPRNSYSVGSLRADAAVLMELMQQGGVSRKIAANTVARRLNRLGYRDGGSKVTGKRVTAWRDEVKIMASTADVAARQFSFALKCLKDKYAKDPMAAFEFYIDCMIDIDMPKILEKGPLKPNAI